MSQNQFLTTYNETKYWLDSMEIDNYTINSKTLEVDVNGSVNLEDNLLKTIPVKFRHVMGDFQVCYNQLTSLHGSPIKLTGDFKCIHNQLITLEGAPKFIRGDFLCPLNYLTTLDGAPNHISGSFSCFNNNLTSLHGGPKYIGQDFRCNNNKLISLQHAPVTIKGALVCHKNKLKTLEGCPSILSKSLVCDGDNDTLFNIVKFVKSVPSIALMDLHPTVFSFMWAFLIKNLTSILIYTINSEQQQVCRIINKHLQNDRSGPACQVELIDAGLAKYIKI